MSKSAANNILNKDLFEQLFKAHFAHLCNFANQYVQDLDSAKDITQKVFVNLWERREKIDPKKPIVSYLFNAVRNRCLNHIRDQKKYRSRILDLDVIDLEISFENKDSDLSELQEKISESLNKLPEKRRLVFEMSRFKNMKYKEIAEELDLSVKTVEAHMSKALKSLRKQLKDYIYLLWVLTNFIH